MTDSASDTTYRAILMAGRGLTPAPDLLQGLAGANYVVYSVAAKADLLMATRACAMDLIIVTTQAIAEADLQLCHTLQRHPQTRLVPIIVISHDQDPASRLQAFAIGAVDYISPTLPVAEIVARIGIQTSHYRQMQSLQRQTQRAMSVGTSLPLLADLQRALRRQTELLQAQNQQLQREMQEREQAQQALRLEQQKSEQLLLNILPRAIVEQLKQLQGSLAERFDDVTILFADIVNFTPIAAQTSPLDLVNWLNQIFSEFDRLAERYQLEKIKTIGDAYMVVGGLPLPMENHVEAVMEMALAMQTAAARIARTDGQDFQLRIGINTGAVVAGVIGIKKFSYDLWGDAVNIASRMEAQGTPGKIQVTEATYQRVKHCYEFAQVGQVMVKGRGYLTTYQYVGRR
ncbi:MAG: adenylate/guanylate cyclase domain-containing response regulator [Leptolyngbyaceae cyanobacterium SM2_5_2]|nr:adenylate/guanylate cyclase domain-containing response regulator [Leptolyngbyaceae cyanobacterium SM2_5_2]